MNMDGTTLAMMWLALWFGFVLLLVLRWRQQRRALRTRHDPHHR